MSKIPPLNRVEAEFFRQADEIATAVMASLDEFADDAAGSVSPEVERWLRRGAAIVQELTTHVLALAAVSTERERTDLRRALDALQARLNAHVAVKVAMNAANPLPHLITAGRVPRLAYVPLHKRGFCMMDEDAP